MALSLVAAIAVPRRLKPRAMRHLLLAAVVFAVMAGPSAQAACTDPAAPRVNWRRCLQDGRDLRGVDLTEAQLRDASFSRTTLDGATLTEADGFHARFFSGSLVAVTLDRARLIEADLTKANLTGASLRGTDLRSARLVEAILRGANLTGARLNGADLRSADLSGATWTDGTRVCAEGSIGQCH